MGFSLLHLTILLLGYLRVSGEPASFSHRSINRPVASEEAHPTYLSLSPRSYLVCCHGSCLGCFLSSYIFGPSNSS